MWATCTADWKVGDSSPGGPSPCAGVHLDKGVKDILGRKGARIKVGSARLRPLSTDGAGILLQIKLFVPVTIYIVPEKLPSVTLNNNQPNNQHSPHVFSIGFLTKYLLIWHRINYISNGLFSSSVNFHIFNFFSETAERNSTKLDRMQDLNVLYQVCVFRADRKNKMAAPASDWLRHFRLLLWNQWTEFNETWQEARSQRPLPSLCFSGGSEKQDGHPDLWLAEIFWTSSLKPLNGIQRNLTGSKILTSSTKFVLLGPIAKTRWPPQPLIGWDILDFFSETAERNSTKLDRNEDLNVFYQVCVFGAGGGGGGGG